MAGLLTPARVDQSARMPGGVLSRALPAPKGWEQGGLVIQFNGCGEPILRDKCEPGTDVADRSTVGEFHAIPFEKGATCSTSGPDSQQDQAFSGLASSTDWILGRQLQDDVNGSGDPNLNDAVTLGTVADANFVAAVSCLEESAATDGHGAQIVLHAPVRAAAYLKANNLIDDNGFSPSGAQWIISAGYQSHPTTPATLVRLYATGTVWASVAEPWAVDNTGYRTNDQESWARNLGVVAFNPCLLQAIDITVPACP